MDGSFAVFCGPSADFEYIFTGYIIFRNQAVIKILKVVGILKVVEMRIQRKIMALLLLYKPLDIVE